MHFDAFWCTLMHFDAFSCTLMHFDAYWLNLSWILMHIWKCIKMHWCASKCISVHQNASNVCRMNCSNVMCTNLSKKWFLFHLIRVKCINMHLNASKCIIMYAEWIISMFCALNFNLKNSNFFGWKWPIFFLSAQNASICIRMHQNVCRMKCANVLCTKISKNG